MKSRRDFLKITGVGMTGSLINPSGTYAKADIENSKNRSAVAKIK